MRTTLERLATFHEDKARAVRDAITILLEHERENGKRERLAPPGRRARRPGPPGKAATRARRRKTFEFLATFDAVTPRRPERANGSGLGTLLRHGYLKRKGKQGYVRTPKPFSIGD